VLESVTLTTCKSTPSRDFSSCGRLVEWELGWNQRAVHHGYHRRFGHRACLACPAAGRSRHRHAHQSVAAGWVKGARLGRLGSARVAGIGQSSEGSGRSD
jgi:hypothetical protein